MTFTSWQFGLFVAIVFGAYYLPLFRTLQIQSLVIASLFFYGYGQPELLPLLAVAVFGTYLFLILALRNRTIWLPIGIAFNLALLAFFKYKFLFVVPTSPSLVGVTPIDFLLRLPLPIGISFFVFHNISLLVDLTRQKTAVPDLKSVFLYIIFFPQLISGPITRAEMFMPQIKPKYFADVPFVEAAKWILTGFFFKLYVANNLNEMTSYMDFPLYETLQTQDRWLLVFLYSYQIYADFFGYSAIAIGLALLFGYRLPVNFNLPYASVSFSEFWTRWHMSLSSWLRTYLYIPLGGNRHGTFRTYLNLIIVMGLGGLWHGAGLGYLMWGLLHGFLLVIERSASSVDRLDRVSGGPHRLCFRLRHHAMDFLQAAELRSRNPLFVRHVYAEHEPEPAKTVLQSGIALFAAGHHAAPGFPLAVRANTARRRAISVWFDGRADVSRGRSRDLIHLFSVLSASMQRTSAAHWFAKCGVSAVTLLIACGIATAWFGNGLQLPSTTTRDGTLITLNRYAKEPIPDVVLAGSSLTFRLKEEYFATPKLRNLALAGGSPVTGLEIVANQPRLPRIVLVEANVLSRQIDTALVERYSRSGNAEPLLFRPIRTAVAAYENWLHAPLNHTQVSFTLRQLLEQPPSNFDSRVYADRALQQLNAEDPTVAIRMNAKRIEQLIPAIERRGARVLLFELPYSEQLAGSRSAKVTREIIHAEFPDPGRWLRIDYAPGELRWADGVHLDERSAVIVSQSIDRTLSSLPGPR